MMVRLFSCTVMVYDLIANKPTYAISPLIRADRTDTKWSSDIVAQAALFSIVKSKCTALKGNTILSPSRSIISDSSIICTSRWTALKSRFKRRASSLIDIGSAPAIALMIFNRFGCNITFVSCSMLGKICTKGSAICFPDSVFLKSAVIFSQADCSDITLTISVFIILPPQCIDVSLELADQLFQSRKYHWIFSVADVFMIAFACFIIVAQSTHTINNINQTVFVVMPAGPNFWINFPDFNTNKGIFFRKIESLKHHYLRRHIPDLHIDDNYNITIVMMSIMSSLLTINSQKRGDK